MRIWEDENEEDTAVVGVSTTRVSASFCWLDDDHCGPRVFIHENDKDTDTDTDTARDVVDDDRNSNNCCLLVLHFQYFHPHPHDDDDIVVVNSYYQYDTSSS